MTQIYLQSSDEERKRLVERTRSGDMTVSNKDVAEAFAIDPNYDPYSIPLDEMDPSHPSLFLHETFAPHFERLRAEDPVHYHEESMFGPYWSITKYKDCMYVDTHHDLFSLAAEKRRYCARRGTRPGRPVRAADVHSGRPAQTR